MSDTIQSFLNDGKLNTSSLTVKIVKTFGDNAYIVADKSKVAILNIEDSPNISKYLNVGYWYKLIKCKKGDSSTIKPNITFKPIKTVDKGDIGDITSDLETLEKTSIKKASDKKYRNFRPRFKVILLFLA